MDYSKKIIKNVLGKLKKDYDMDGVPDDKDCQPKNPMRQDIGINRLKTIAGRTQQNQYSKNGGKYND